MDKNLNQQKETKKGNKIYIPLSLTVITIIVIGVLWYRNYSRYITSDDAYIDADRIAVGAKILGRISKIYAEEGDSVKKGMLLAEIDSSELLAQKLQFISLKNQSISTKKQVEAKYAYDLESIKIQEISYNKASDDLARAKPQFEGGVLTKEQFEHIQKAYESAKAQLEAAKSSLNVSKAQISSTQAAVESSEAQINVSTVQLKNTRLFSPIDGIVAKRWLMAGDIAQPGQSIYTITNDKNLWVSVYLEETKLTGIKINQKAIFTVDACPGITFYGKITSISSNTASQFSLIPPSNASGNFTKITQRVPLKISIDSTENNKVVPVKLLSGMSVVVKIIR